MIYFLICDERPLRQILSMSPDRSFYDTQKNANGFYFFSSAIFVLFLDGNTL